MITNMSQAMRLLSAGSKRQGLRFWAPKGFASANACRALRTALARAAFSSSCDIVVSVLKILFRGGASSRAIFRNSSAAACGSPTSDASCNTDFCNFDSGVEILGLALAIFPFAANASRPSRLTSVSLGLFTKIGMFDQKKLLCVRLAKTFGKTD